MYLFKSSSRNKNVQNLPPIIVMKQQQVLLHLKTMDFSFVGEAPMARLYEIFEDNETGNNYIIFLSYKIDNLLSNLLK